MNFLRDLVESATPSAAVIISISFMLIFGFLMTRITKKLRLPNVTAFILVGILIGPYVLDLIPTDVIDGMDFLSDIAVALIAFVAGEFFRIGVLKRNGIKVIVIALLAILIMLPSASGVWKIISPISMRLIYPIAPTTREAK